MSRRKCGLRKGSATLIDRSRANKRRVLQCHDSQVSGGKRYDRAVVARQQANATLASGETVDHCDACVLAMDLRPLVDDPAMTVQGWLARCLDRFTAELLDG